MRWRLALCGLLIAISQVLASAAVAADPWLNEGFESGTEGVFSSGAWGMEPLDSGHVGAGLRSVIPVGENWGSSGHWYLEDHGLSQPDELWWRYWLKFPEGFWIEPPDRGKLPGPANLYTYNCLGGRPTTPEEPCWSARMLFSRDYSDAVGNYWDGPSDKTLIGFYTYHVDGPTDRGDILTWDENVALLEHDRWYCVEGRIRLNTPGVNDGVLEGWVDGQPAYSRADFQWRRAAEGFLGVDSFWFDVYYGGETADEIYFDSLALGPERLGCGDAGWEGTFSDDDGSIYAADIEWLAAAGITEGCNPPDNTLFCPDDNVTRGQMAAFLVRALAYTDAGAGDLFSDDDGSIYESDIDRLATAEVTKGCNPPGNDWFCPDDPVSRGQMAAFLVRALGLTDDGGGNTFTDDDGSVFEADVARLAAAEITLGCNPPDNTLFCPDDPVTRGQMAAFLHRALEG